jgi:hypothetical protein
MTTLTIIGTIEGLHNGRIKVTSNYTEYLINIIKYKEVIKEDVLKNVGKKASVVVVIKQYRFMYNGILREGVSYNLKSITIL